MGGRVAGLDLHQLGHRAAPAERHRNAIVRLFEHGRQSLEHAEAGLKLAGFRSACRIAAYTRSWSGSGSAIVGGFISRNSLRTSGACGNCAGAHRLTSAPNRSASSSTRIFPRLGARLIRDEDFRVGQRRGRSRRADCWPSTSSRLRSVVGGLSTRPDLRMTLHLPQMPSPPQTEFR